MKIIVIAILLTALFGCAKEEKKKQPWQAPPASNFCPELKDVLDRECITLECWLEKEDAFRECSLRTRVY